MRSGVLQFIALYCLLSGTDAARNYILGLVLFYQERLRYVVALWALWPAGPEQIAPIPSTPSHRHWIGTRSCQMFGRQPIGRQD